MHLKKKISRKSAALEIILKPDLAPVVNLPTRTSETSGACSKSLEAPKIDSGNGRDPGTCDYCSSIFPVVAELGAIIQELRQLPEEIRAAMNNVKEWYTTEEFGKVVDRAGWTIRKRCHEGRLNGVKVDGRGPHGEWRLSYEELLRFQREGYLDP